MLADTVAVWAVVTAATFAVNVAVVELEAIATLDGTVTALLLLARLTLTPPDGAAELSDIVQDVDPAPVNDLLPHEKALIAGANGDPDPLRLMDVVFVTDPCVAVSVTLCDDATDNTLAAKLALFAPDGNDTEGGTVTALLLLARVTFMPLLGAAAVNVTVQASGPVPVMVDFAQLSPANDAAEEDPLPCSLTLLATVTKSLVLPSTLSWPVVSVADPGS